jgi:arylsulfatase A-like enzyme
LPGDAWTLPEELRCQGFATAIFAANNSLRVNSGFDLGWDEPENSRDGGPIHATSIAGTQRWVEGHAADRFFLFTVVTDLLIPFAPIEGVPPAPGFWERVDPQGPRPRLSPSDVSSVHDGYARRLERIDTELGALLDRLVATDRARDTLVVVTADHGEWLGDRGRLGHPRPDPALRVVPLFFWGAALPHPPPSVIPAIDVAPTILAALGLALPGSMEGSSIGTRRLHGGLSPRVYERAEQNVSYELCLQLAALAYGNPASCTGLPTEQELASRTAARVAFHRCPAQVR